MTSTPDRPDLSLYWLPLGAGASPLVRVTGLVYEAWSARRQHRRREDLYHSALRATVGGERYVIEVAPVWDRRDPDRGVVATGPVGSVLLGRSPWFRYEVRCWRGGTIPDEAYAVGGPIAIPTDAARLRRLLDVLPDVPTLTWGRDELGVGDMWNSNSVIAWCLLQSGHHEVSPPAGGRAPGWRAGVEQAGTSTPSLRSWPASSER